MKRCTKCGEMKAPEEFWKLARSPDGRYPSCATCEKAAKRAHYLANRERLAATSRANHLANRDSILAQRRAKYAADPEPFKAAMRAFYAEHREEIRLKSLKHRQEHRDEIRARAKRYRAENLEQVRARNRAYNAANAETHRARTKAWVAANRERKRQYDKEWRESHRDQVAAFKQARRAMKKGAFVERVHRSKLLRLHDGLCGICGEPVDPDDFHVDHILALALGGKHSYANTQPAHPACNLRKGPKQLEGQAV